MRGGEFSFRGAPFCTRGNFVADTSPIGEVFFATPDFTMNRRPVLRREMIPNGIVKLLAAIWL